MIIKKNSEEVIPLSNIQSFRLQKPNITGYGVIEFKNGQANTFGVNLGFGIGAGIGSTFVVQYHRKHVETAIAIQEYVEKHRSALPSDPGTDCEAESRNTSECSSVVSVADELRALKSLLDDGIITEDDFNAKKKSLLGI